MTGPLLLTVESSAESQTIDITELGTQLEKCCFRDVQLEGKCRRFYVESPGQPLGLTWKGTLELVVAGGKPLAALTNAIFTAFGKREVRLFVQRGSTTIKIEMKNTNLTQLGDLLHQVMSDIDRT